jgi:pimeloyl-ACP methyl ester carboxylesterase
MVACTTDPGVTAVPGASTRPGTTGPGTTADDTRISWGKCTDERATDATLQCATFTVPLDYTGATSSTIDLALVRAPATAKRKGAVLFNPGGPGGSGFDSIAVNGIGIQRTLGLDAYDIVGFDPRGVDRSGGIRCVDDAFRDAHLYLDDTPDTPEEQRLLDEADTGFIDGCRKNYGTTLKLYSTENTARDMDRIRIGLGDDQLSFLGVSYGTYLGATYATLFPERVRAMALDSAFEPNGDTVEQQWLTQAVGFEGAFRNWAKWCEGDSACPYRAADVAARWEALRTTLDAHPLVVGGRAVNQSTLDVATAASLYSQSDWTVLADAATKAERGDGSGLLSLADGYEQRNADGTFDTLYQSIVVIKCASGIQRQSPSDPQALFDQLRAQAPHTTEGMTVKDLTDSERTCQQLTGTVKPVALGYRGKGPIVVVGGTNDPATPIRWAAEMTAELGPNARMVTYTGEGHGQLLVSSCVTKVEAAVLADTKLPAADTTCDADPKVTRPDWWDRLPVPSGFSGVVALPAVGAALGLSDTVGYGEIRTTTMAVDATMAASQKAMEGAGFTPVGTQDLGIPDTGNEVYRAPNGDLLVVIAMGPKAFESKDLQNAASAVPAGATVVLTAYVPS